MMRYGFLIATIFGFQSQAVFGQPVFVNETTLLCARPDAVHSLSGLKPPGAGVPGSTVADPPSFSEVFRYGQCIWLSPKTSLLETGLEDDLSRVRMTGQPQDLFVKSTSLTAGVGATPTARGNSEHDMLEQVKVAIERRVEFLQQQLRPTSDQQPLFDAYADALRTYSLDSIILDSEFRRGLPRANAVGVLDFRQRGMQFEADRLKEQLRLFLRLYDSLTPSQRITADHLSAP